MGHGGARRLGKDWGRGGGGKVQWWGGLREITKTHCV